MDDHPQQAGRPLPWRCRPAQSRRRQQLPATAADGSSDAGGFDVETSLLHRALEIIRPDFEDRTWQAFWRATVEGHTAADIAQDFGMTPRAVRQAKYRVLQRLRTELDDLQAC